MSPGQTSRLLLGLGLATWMEFYTCDAVNLVLPDMAGSFGIAQDQSSWFLTTYSSAFFLGVPVSIWLAAHVGHLRYIIGSSVLFAIASLGCSTAHDVQTMLLARHRGVRRRRPDNVVARKRLYAHSSTKPQ